MTNFPESFSSHLFQITIDPVACACTAGFLLENMSGEDKPLAEEVARQVQLQLGLQGINSADVMKMNRDVLPETFTFSIPGGFAMMIVETLLENKNGPEAEAVSWLMGAWDGAVKELREFVEMQIRKEEGEGPYDSMGNCMN